MPRKKIKAKITDRKKTAPEEPPKPEEPKTPAPEKPKEPQTVMTVNRIGDRLHIRVKPDTKLRILQAVTREGTENLYHVMHKGANCKVLRGKIKAIRLIVLENGKEKELAKVTV